MNFPLSYSDFLRRATAALGIMGAQPILPSPQAPESSWLRGWDVILLWDQPGQPGIFAFTQAPVSELALVQKRIDALVGGWAQQGLFTGSLFEFVVVVSSPVALASSTARKKLTNLRPSTFYPGLRPSTWAVDLTAGQLYSGTIFRRPRGSELLRRALSRSNGDQLDLSPNVEVMRARAGGQNSSFYALMGGRRPVVTYVLIAINVFVFVALSVYAGSPEGAQYGRALDTFGDSSAFLVLHGQWWRLFTAMFLHGSIAHVLLNMISLLYLGSIAERLYGSPKYLFIYLGSGLAGSVASVLFNSVSGDPRVASVGASGAIFGLAGALLSIRFQRSEVVPQSVRDRISSSIFPIVVINLVGANFLGAHIDNSAHVGGVLGGFALSFLARLPQQASGRV